MKYMMTYDLMESMRNTNQWLGATAHAFASYPVMSWGANPAMDWLKAWGEVTERTFSRMIMKPDWNIPPVSGEKGKDYPVVVETVVEKPFGDLIHFTMPGRKASKRTRGDNVSKPDGQQTNRDRSRRVSSGSTWGR